MVGDNLVLKVKNWSLLTKSFQIQADVSINRIIDISLHAKLYNIHTHKNSQSESVKALKELNVVGNIESIRMILFMSHIVSATTGLHTVF